MLLNNLLLMAELEGRTFNELDTESQMPATFQWKFQNLFSGEQKFSNISYPPLMRD